ncbi:IS3 family transposase [Paraclostridium sordellii]|uniref:IS3 family transposase n=1 Tax=Paraclostridium sordellii TaxID=1505 RepID=UPI0012D82FE5
MSSKYNISNLCKLVGVSRNAYYKCLSRCKKTTDRDNQNKIIKQNILNIHKKYRCTYSRKRICIYLNKILPFAVNHERIYRLMNEIVIQFVIRKKYMA